MSPEQFIELVINLITGVLGMPLTQWLKKQFGADDTSAFALSIAVSGILAILALFVTGVLGIADFAWAALPSTLAVVWSTATLVYNLIRGRVKS